jgi:oligopeptide/dipeptide ABC transporter ATP-binding protein
MTAPLLALRKVSVYYGKRKTIKALDCVSLSMERGESLGLVGESGCGKTTLARVVTGLAQPDQGVVQYAGQRVIPGHFHPGLQMVFQDPYSSLNPRLRVQDILAEALARVAKPVNQTLQQHLTQALQEVGLPQVILGRYPAALSGGQRQRVALARALLARPQLLVLDEPLSALDTSVQSRLLALLLGLKQKNRLSYLFISHHLPAVSVLCDRVAVMYAGSLVETGPAADIFRHPRHFYTRMLLEAILTPDPGNKQKIRQVTGELPDPLHLPSGCRFHPRCSQGLPVCRRVNPAPVLVADSHWAACHRA